jgi:serine/threonine protein kinase
VRLSQTGAFVGSVEYGAPEQFRDPETVDARADLHALGVVLYELATGVHPFHAGGFHAVVRRILDEVPRPAAELNPQLSPFLEEVVRTLLEKDRQRRFASADSVARVLESGEESEWWRERAAAIRSSTKRPLRRIRIPRETAVYGRDADLARLRALYETSRAGDGQVVLVEGEAGINFIPHAWAYATRTL